MPQAQTAVCSALGSGPCKLAPTVIACVLLQALPTCLLFRDGVLVDRVNGFMPESNFGRRVRFYVARMDKKFGRR